MSSIKVTVVDATENKSGEFEIGAEDTAGALAPTLAEQLELPLKDPSGAPVSYRLQLKRTGELLDDSVGMAAAGVKEGDALRLSTAMVAG